MARRFRVGVLLAAVAGCAGAAMVMARAPHARAAGLECVNAYNMCIMRNANPNGLMACAQEQIRCNANASSAGRDNDEPADSPPPRRALGAVARSTTSESGPKGDAKRCVRTTQYRIYNDCDAAIDVVWCDYTNDELGGCERKGFDSSVSLAAGGSYPLEPLRDSKTTVTRTVYGACFGAYSMKLSSEGSKAMQYSCDE